MKSKEELLLESIFNSKEDPEDNYPETISEKVGYSEYVVAKSIENLSAGIWRLIRLGRLLLVSEKDGKNTLPDIIANNEARMALEPLLRAENDISEVVEILREIYDETKPVEGGQIMPRSHINERLHTELASTGRAAGMGISYDKYDDEDGYRPGPVHRGAVRMPSDELTPAEKAALSGPVRVYKEGKA